MKIVTSKLRERVIEARIADWPRILPSRHRSTPANAGFGSSRFSSPSGVFRVLYAADNFPTAFAEAVVRDRFKGKTRRFLYRPHQEQLLCDFDQFEPRTGAARSARRRHLRGWNRYGRQPRTHSHFGPSPVRSGARRDDRYRRHRFQLAPDHRRLRGVYDRASSALSGTPPVALLQATLLPAELTRLGITVRRKRGYAAP